MLCSSSSPVSAPAARIFAEADSFLPTMRRIAARPWGEGGSCKDIPRLVKRTTYTAGGGAAVMSESEDPRTLPLVRDLLVMLTRDVEPEREAAVREALADLSPFENLEEQVAVADMLAAVGGDDSAAVRVLRLMHQGVVLHAKAIIVSTFGIITKDVREARGWRVGIEVNEGNVQVTHTRVEQSIDTSTSEHYEFTWCARVTLNRSVTEVTNASLRVNNLDFGEGMDEERKRELRRTLVGDVIVA